VSRNPLTTADRPFSGTVWRYWCGGRKNGIFLREICRCDFWSWKMTHPHPRKKIAIALLRVKRPVIFCFLALGRGNQYQFHLIGRRNHMFCRNTCCAQQRRGERGGSIQLWASHKPLQQKTRGRLGVVASVAYIAGCCIMPKPPLVQYTPASGIAR